MIHDPRAEVTCETVGCRETIEIECGFRGTGSHGYGWTESEAKARLERNGWEYVDDDETYCESCAERRKKVKL